MMSSLGQRDKRAFYRPENKSIIFVVTEEVCIQMVLYLCQMIFKQKSQCLIHYPC